jgi:dUTP pyrophosphatase
MRIRIRRLHEHATLPVYQTAGAAAFDLCAAEEAVVAPGEVRLIGTGLVVEVPAGCWLAIVARSSLPIRKRLVVANGVGVIDPDYRGPEDEVKVEVLNFSSEPVRVERGERIAQGLIVASPRVEWEEVAASAAPSRGGFGRTAGYHEPS